MLVLLLDETLLLFDVTLLEALEALLMGEVDAKEIDVEDGDVSIYGDPSDLYKIKDAITNAKKDAEFIVDEVTYLPNEMVTLDGEDKPLGAFLFLATAVNLKFKVGVLIVLCVLRFYSYYV